MRKPAQPPAQVSAKKAEKADPTCPEPEAKEEAQQGELMDAGAYPAPAADGDNIPAAPKGAAEQLLRWVRQLAAVRQEPKAACPLPYHDIEPWCCTWSAGLRASSLL